MSRFIDMTPTWPQAARIIAAALENGTDKGREAARTELFRMAELLDQMQQTDDTAQDFARFDVIADGYDRPPFGQSFATAQRANAYAATLTARGYTVDVRPAVDPVSVADALTIAAAHFDDADLAAEPQQ